MTAVSAILADDRIAADRLDSSTLAVTGCLLLIRDAVEMFVGTNEEFAVADRRGRIEAVPRGTELVLGKQFQLLRVGCEHAREAILIRIVDLLVD